MHCHQGNSQETDQVDTHTHSYFKELAYVVVGTGEAKICGADQDAGSTSQRRLL